MFKKGTLESINHHLRSAEILNIVAKRDVLKEGSFVLSCEDGATDEQIEAAKEIVAELVGSEMWWGKARPRK